MSKDKYDNNFLRKSLDLKKIREEQQQNISSNALYQRSKQKILTTSIGALYAMEKQLGFLWGWVDTPDGESRKYVELTEEQLEFKQMYEKVRAEILDNGNDQMKIMLEDFSDYDIKRKKHKINLPVVNRNKNLGDKKDGKK
jgi:hypothetical protein